MMLVIAFSLIAGLVYCIGVMVGSSVEKQRLNSQMSPLTTVRSNQPASTSGIPERHIYAEHQRMFDENGELVWEQKTYSKNSGFRGYQKVDVLA